MTASYFKNVKFLSTDTPFRTDRKVELEIANATLGKPETLSDLKEKYGDFSSNFGAAFHTMVWTRLDIWYSMTRFGYFQTVLSELGYLLMHNIM